MVSSLDALLEELPTICSARADPFQNQTSRPKKNLLAVRLPGGSSFFFVLGLP
jgi:hypothetical protein